MIKINIKKKTTRTSMITYEKMMLLSNAAIRSIDKEVVFFDDYTLVHPTSYRYPETVFFKDMEAGDQFTLGCIVPIAIHGYVEVTV